MTASTTGELSFWTSYNTEPNWDFVFVEAQTLNPDGTGRGDWTTLPDANGHTSQETGASCASSWGDALHERTLNYQTVVPNGPGTDDDSCTPTGTTGAWHAASGNSGGWQEWSIDLDRIRRPEGRALDRLRHGLGHADRARRAGGRHDRHAERRRVRRRRPSRRISAAGTCREPIPRARRRTLNDWLRSEVIFEEAAVTKTDEGLVFGFGFEGVNTEEARAELMRRTLGHLLPSG